MFIASAQPRQPSPSGAGCFIALFWSLVAFVCLRAVNITAPGIAICQNRRSPRKFCQPVGAPVSNRPGAVDRPKPVANRRSAGVAPVLITLFGFRISDFGLRTSPPSPPPTSP